MAVWGTEIHQLGEELEVMTPSAGKGAPGRAPEQQAGELGMVGGLKLNGCILRSDQSPRYFSILSHFPCLSALHAAGMTSHCKLLTQVSNMN